MANDTTKLHRHRRAAEPQRLPPGARGHRGHHPLAFCEGHGGASSGCNEGYSDLITKLGTLEDCKGAWMLFDMRDFCGLAPDGIICVPRMRTIGKETRAELEDSATSQGGRCWSEPNEVIVRVLRGSQPAHWTGICELHLHARVASPGIPIHATGNRIPLDIWAFTSGIGQTGLQGHSVALIVQKLDSFHQCCHCPMGSTHLQ